MVSPTDKYQHVETGDVVAGDPVTDNTDVIKLTELIHDMDIPHERRNDLGWLMRNLDIRNSQHPNCAEALTLIKSMWRKDRNAT